MVDTNQLLPLLADAIERFENLGNFPLHRSGCHEPLQRRAGLLVLRRDRQNLLIRLDGLGQIAQGNLQNLRQPVGQRHDLVFRVGQADFSANDVGKILPTLGHSVETIECHQPVFAVGLGVGHALEGCDGLVNFAGLFLVHPSQTHQHLDLEAGVHHTLDFAFNSSGQLGPTPAGFRHAIEMGDDLRIGRICAHCAAVGVERRVEVRQATLIDPGHRTQKVHAARDILGIGDHHFVGHGDLVPVGG